MILDKFDDILPPERTKKVLIVSLISMILIYMLIGYLFLLSGNPGNAFESQLSFSGSYMKTYYKNTANIDYYRLAEAVDFGFMVAYGSLMVSLALTIARKFEEGTNLRTIGYVMAVIGIITPCLDAIENSFIMLMLTDPSGFPDIWAVLHSSFALIKWVLLIIALMYALIATLIRKIKND